MAKRPIPYSTRGRKPAVRIILKPLMRHGARGMQQGRTIWVDPRDPAAAQTLLHETLHMDNPSWSESRVLREAAARWRRMTWREKAELLRMFGRAQVGDDE